MIDIYGRFALLLWGLLLEALPFLLFGAFIASLVHLYMTPERLKRMVPANLFAAVFVAGAAGLVFPLCECAIVPVVRNLVRKGLPYSVGFTILVAVPLVNPVVMASTWYAFRDLPPIFFSRFIFGYGIAVLLGLFFLTLENRFHLRKAAGDEHAEADHRCRHETTFRAGEIVSHTGSEFLSTLRYFLLGALVTTLIQVAVPPRALLSFGGGPVASVPVMMGLAYIFSVCSEADAFIARGLVSYFSPGAVLAFLVFGPMMDLKNTVLLLKNFSPRTVAVLVAATTVLCLAVGILFNYFGPWRST
jgi:hypothetical protein